ncbi:hypothetical protein [Catellatospora sp. NPDC049609]|uniref:hypothetical protein n=1 Tax=Catellatospora sp. NPDC049609 TaxID=3155505 RepID=UPI0034155B4B
MSTNDTTVADARSVFEPVNGLEVFLLYVKSLNRRIEAVTAEVTELRRSRRTRPAASSSESAQQAGVRRRYSAWT